ncbi:lipid-A-disaccharide synthase [Desulfurivibrio sp. D14AmB]|uniref:lipid-A-disaccharide synthase n=1 Tax=Desulfurivibrio sp. D14AmB TaxID=3374370 RepID=UPI00376EC4EA
MANSQPHILIVAGEASGDMHGANLVKAIKAQRPEVRISAMGGGALAAQGVNLVYESSRLAVVGLIEVLSHLGEIRAALAKLRAFLREQRPELLILIDYPDFNLMLAATAKKLGIPVFYYISPQVWAWRQGRVRTIRQRVDMMAVILPFEQEFYRNRGVAVEFVGHPLLDELAEVVSESPTPHGGPGRLIGLLPGSRRRELATMLPIFLAAARRLAAQLPTPPRFVLPLAPGLDPRELQGYGLDQAADLQIEISTEQRHRTMARCDVVMAASGTVTLELAILGVPMVAAYKLSPLSYLLGRLLIDLPHATLVNLVAGREVIPELLQYEATPEKISRAVADLLEDEGRRAEMVAALAQVRQQLGGSGASQRAAALALAMLESSRVAITS